MEALTRNSTQQNGFAHHPPPPPPPDGSFSSFDSSCHNGGFVFDDNSEGGKNDSFNRGGSNNNHNNNLHKIDSLSRGSVGENPTAVPSTSHDALAFWERQRRLFDRMHLTFATSEPPEAPSCVKLEIAGSESLLINISEPPNTGTALGEMRVQAD